MFGLNKATTASGFGSFAGGALTMQGLNKLASRVSDGKSKIGSGKGEKSNSDNESQENSRIRTQNRDFAQSFNSGDGEQGAKQLAGGQSANAQIENGQGTDGQDGQVQDSDEKQRLLDDREVWSNMANDPNETNQNRIDAQQEVDNIDEQMKKQGDLGDGQKTQEQSEDGRLPKPNGANRLNGNGMNKDWKKRLAIKGFKSGRKMVYKGAKKLTRGVVRGGAVIGGATIGLAAGVATGDLSKAAQFASAGVIAGNAIGKKAANISELPETLGKKAVQGVNSIRDSADGVKYEVDKAKYGTAYAAEQRNIKQDARERNRFLNDKEEKKKYEEMADRISISTGRDVKAEDLMKSAYDYKKAGITDEKQIENGLAMETRYKDQSNIHENMLDIVGMTNKYGEEYVMDDKKRESLQKRITTGVKGEENQNKVWNMYTETLGFKNLDKSYDIQRNKTNSKPVQQQQVQQQPIRQQSANQPIKKPKN